MPALPAAPQAHEIAAPPLPKVGVGGVREFLLVGGATPLLLLASWLLRARFELDALELGVGFTMFYAAHLINDPHFSVTYVLFYEDARHRAFGTAFPPGLRRRYWFAGLVVPLGLAGWGAYGLSQASAFSLGLLMQLMFALVGWHYVKQGFGVTLVLSGRRGLRFSPLERRALLVHCLCAWAYAWSSPATPGHAAQVKGVPYTAFARPAWFEEFALTALLVSLAWLFGCLLRKRLREGPLPLWTPLTALLASTWAWSIYAHADPLVRYVVPALHALQYLYFVSLYKGHEAREREGAPWFEASASTRLARLALTALVLGWLLFDGLPEALDAWLADGTQGLGPTPYFAVAYAFVNLHHYFMDTVLWRREQPGTRYLRQ